MNGVRIPGCLNCPDCEITAIADISSTVPEKTAARPGLASDRCFSGYKELFAFGLVDAVDIVTSNDALCIHTAV